MPILHLQPVLGLLYLCPTWGPAMPIPSLADLASWALIKIQPFFCHLTSWQRRSINSKCSSSKTFFSVPLHIYLLWKVSHPSVDIINVCNQQLWLLVCKEYEDHCICSYLYFLRFQRSNPWVALQFPWVNRACICSTHSV